MSKFLIIFAVLVFVTTGMVTATGEPAESSQSTVVNNTVFHLLEGPQDRACYTSSCSSSCRSRGWHGGICLCSNCWCWRCV